MSINVLFSLKNCKNRQTLEGCKNLYKIANQKPSNQNQAPDSLASGSWGICPETPKSVFIHCKLLNSFLCTSPQAQT